MFVKGGGPFGERCPGKSGTNVLQQSVGVETSLSNERRDLLEERGEVDVIHRQFAWGSSLQRLGEMPLEAAKHDLKLATEVVHMRGELAAESFLFSPFDTGGGFREGSCAEIGGDRFDRMAEEADGLRISGGEIAVHLLWGGVKIPHKSVQESQDVFGPVASRASAS